jgi:peptidoglycan/xylan/chitin deacetylase (PgdA/CDA1 family)
MKKTTHPHKRYISFFDILIVGILVAIVISAHSFIRTLHDEFRPLDDRRNEMTKLPQNIADRLREASPSAGIRVPVVLYHYVEYVTDKRDTIRKSLSITPDTFDRQIKTLIDAGYTFMTMKDVSDVLDGRMSLPKNPVVFTFDDGYRDFYTDVFPIVKKYQIKVVAYVVPGFLDKPNYMFTPQLLEIARSGLVEIGAHTMTHLYLKGGHLDKVKEEVTSSKRALEALLHYPVVSFAYPYGAFDQQAIDVVHASGFWTAVSTLPGDDENQKDRLFIPRVRLGARYGEELVQYLAAYPGGRLPVGKSNSIKY